ncbi:MAG TPA: hypothetical protein PK530_04745, partial [Anaerolineales bacterium]|nr:hypothetical protein [Anaerolineales bacterium]
MTLRLTEGTRARVTVEVLDESGQLQQTGTVELSAPVGEKFREETLVFHPPGTSLAPETEVTKVVAGQRVRPRLAVREWSLATWLFLLGLVIYLGVRFIGLPDYPIYFFSDEAISTVLALDLVNDNFVHEGTFLPTFFRNDRKFSLGTTVYLNILPALLLGKSIWVARGTAAVTTLLAAVCIGLTLKRVFLKPYWWMGPLILSIAPAWFLHSRTGFETAIAASFFAAFIYFYLLYRTYAPKYLFAALIFGGLTFYGYAPGQMVMLSAGLGLLLADFPYHWKNRNVTVRGVAILILMALPYIRFHLNHPGALAENLRESTSYLIGDYTIAEKLRIFLQQYFTGLSPLYWFFPNGIDIPRHTMGTHGNLLWITLPFALIGVVDAVRFFRSPAWRTVLIAALASPVGAAISGLGVTRALFFVIPITILTTLGFIKTLEWGAALFKQIRQRSASPKNAMPRNLFRPTPTGKLEIGLFVFLALCNVTLLGDALINGPFWYTDYSFYGMQYGERQVFEKINEMLVRSPDIKIKLSPDWANGLPVLARFFLYDPLPIEIESLKGYMNEHREIDPHALFIVPLSDYIGLSESGKFNLRVVESVSDPNGNLAFAFLRAEYVANIDDILAQEAAARHQLRDAFVDYAGKIIA